MGNDNSKGIKENTYDAIVIGSGISGGWAAKELCEQGIRTLVLERGRDVKHLVDYPTMSKDPWDFPHRNHLTIKEKEGQPRCFKMLCFQGRCHAIFCKRQRASLHSGKTF